MRPGRPHAVRALGLRADHHPLLALGRALLRQVGPRRRPLRPVPAGGVHPRGVRGAHKSGRVAAMFIDDAHILRASSSTVCACTSKRLAIARIWCGSVIKRVAILAVCPSRRVVLDGVVLRFGDRRPRECVAGTVIDIDGGRGHPLCVVDIRNCRAGRGHGHAGQGGVRDDASAATWSGCASTRACADSRRVRPRFGTGKVGGLGARAFGASSPRYGVPGAVRAAAVRGGQRARWE